MVAQQLGVLQAELDQALVAGLFPLVLQRGPAVPGVGLVPADGEAQSGLDRRVLVGDVVAPMPVAGLQPQRVHGVVAGQGQAVGLARLHQRVVELHRVLVGQVQLPAELAHVAHAQGQHVDAGDVDALGRAEREVGVVERRVGERGQHEAGLGAHQPDHGPVLGDVGDLDVTTATRSAQAGPVPGLGRGRGHHQEPVEAEAGHGQVGLDAALIIAPLRVRRLAHRHVDAGGAQLVEHRQRVGSVHGELGERGLIEQRHLLPHGPALLAGVGPPVLLAVAVGVLPGLATCGVPVGPLPARGLAEHRPGRIQAVVQGRHPLAPGALVLVEGPVHGVQQPQALGDALGQVGGVGLERKRPADVDRRQVHGRVAVGDPVGQGPAHPSRGLDAHRVEPGGHEAPVHLRGLPQVVHPVGGERLRTVEEQLDAALPQRGHPVDGPLEDRPDVVPVLAQRAEGEVAGDAVEVPHLAPGLEEAGHDLAGLLLEVRVVAGVAQHRRVSVESQGLGDDVEVLAGLQRHVDPDLGR